MQHRRTTAVSIFQNSISQNTNVTTLSVFPNPVTYTHTHAHTHNIYLPLVFVGYRLYLTYVKCFLFSFSFASLLMYFSVHTKLTNNSYVFHSQKYNRLLLLSLHSLACLMSKNAWVVYKWPYLAWTRRQPAGNHHTTG